MPDRSSDPIDSRDGRARQSLRKRWALGIALVAACFAVYLPTLDAGFLHDDDELLTGNAAVQRGGRTFGPEAWAGLRQAWSPWEPTVASDIPLTVTTFWLEWRLWGTHEANAPPEARGIGGPGYHATNILIHTISALLLWRLLYMLGVPGAWLAALFWGVHPVCVESVAWISERKNTLSMLFLLSSSVAWVRWLDTGHRAPRMRASLWFLLSLLSKPAAAPLPAVLLLMTWWKRGRLTLRDVRAAAPMFAIGIAVGLFATYVQSTYAIAGEEMSFGTPIERLYRASFAVGFYLWKALTPLGLLPHYPRWHETIPWYWQSMPGVTLGVLFVFGYRARKSWGRHLIFALGSFVLLVSPALCILDMSYHRMTLVADHFQYYSLAALNALVVGSAATLAQMRPTFRIPIRATGAAVAAALGTLAFAYAAYFDDNETLWTYTLEHNPDSWQGHSQIGTLRLREDQPHEALPHLERAVELAPQIAELHNNLAVTLDRLGKPREARRTIRRALAIRGDDPSMLRNLAGSLLAEGRFAEALEHYTAALRLDPDAPRVWIAAGTALFRLGRHAEAAEHFEAALARNPDSVLARQNLRVAREKLREPAARPLPADPDPADLQAPDPHHPDSY